MSINCANGNFSWLNFLALLAETPYYCTFSKLVHNSPRYGHHHHLTLLVLHLVPSSSPFIVLLVLLVRVLPQPREELRRALDGHALPLLEMKS